MKTEHKNLSLSHVKDEDRILLMDKTQYEVLVDGLIFPIAKAMDALSKGEGVYCIKDYIDNPHILGRVSEILEKDHNTFEVKVNVIDFKEFNPTAKFSFINDSKNQAFLVQIGEE